MDGSRKKRRRLSVSACALAIAASCGLSSADAAETQTLQGIERYCAASWRQAGIAAQDWSDCTQEVYLRLLERVDREHLTEALADAESRERRQLMRCIWATTQKWRRARRHCSLGDHQIADERTADGNFPATLPELCQIVRETPALLTAVQEKVLLRWLEGESIAEIAERYDLPRSQVSDVKYKALQRLRSHLDA